MEDGRILKWRKWRKVGRKEMVTEGKEGKGMKARIGRGGGPRARLRLDRGRKREEGMERKDRGGRRVRRRGRKAR